MTKSRPNENPSGWDITKFASDLYKRMTKEVSVHKWYFSRFEIWDRLEDDQAKELLWVSLIYFISKWWEDDIIDDIIEYSIQGGCNKWFDLNGKFYHYNRDAFALPEVIIRWNYKLFQKLLDLKINFLQFNSLRSLNIWSNKETWKMLKDLLDLGLLVNEQDILNAIERGDYFTLEVIYNHESHQWENKVFTLKFLQNILDVNFEKSNYNSAKYSLKNNKDGNTKNFLTQVYYKLQIESKLSQKDAWEVTDTAVEIIWEELEDKIRDRIWAPEFIASIVAGILEEQWDDLTEKIVAWLKEEVRAKVIARSPEIVEVLIWSTKER